MKRKSIPIIAVALLAFGQAAWAQAPCSQQTVTGTYAVMASGFAAVGALQFAGQDPYYALHGGSSVFVGPVTIAPDGTATGTWWGVYVAFPVEFAFAGHVTINPDCTGEYTDGDGTNKLVVLDEGNEIRAMRWQGFGTSVTTWSRITRADEVAPRCSLQTLRGAYMQRCQGFDVASDQTVATHDVLLQWTAKDGVLSGTFWGKKFGFPDSLTESPVSGTYTVADDCTVDIDYSFQFLPPGLTMKARGVLYNQGKSAVGLPLGVYFGDTFVAPMAPLTCEFERIGR